MSFITDGFYGYRNSFELLTVI